MTKQRPSAVFLVWNVVFSAVAVALAALVWWPIYQSSAFVVMAASAVGAGVVISVVGSLLRWPALAVVGATVLVFLLTGVALAVPGQAIGGVLPTVPGILSLLEGSSLGFRQLVTIATPVGSYQNLLAPAFVSILATSTLTTSFALRLTRPGAALIWPFALAAVGIALGTDKEWMPVALGLGLAVVSLIWLSWLRAHRETTRGRAHTAAVGPAGSSRRERRRSALVVATTSSLVVVLAALGGVVAASALRPTTERDVLRTHVEQPFDPRAYTSPLTGFRSYLRPENVDLPLVEASGLPGSGRLRLATLDTWNGVVYSVGSAEVDSASGIFARVPFRFDQRATGQNVTIGVTVDAYSGPWVPGVGNLREITFSGSRADALTNSYFYNDVTGTSAVLAELGPGDGYTMSAVVAAEPTPDELALLEPGSAVLPEPARLPQSMIDQLNGWTRDQTTPGGKLAALIDGIRSNGYISHGLTDDEPVSRSGHGSDRLDELFTAKPMVGDQEQYAVATALLAREIGFPARVVMGFVPGGAAGAADASVAEGSGSTDASAGERTLTFTGGDVHAWVEVQASDGRWLTVDSTPAIRDIPEKEPEDPTTVARPQPVVQPPLEEKEQQAEQTTPDSAEDDEQPVADPFLQVLLVVLQVLGWVVLVAALLAAPVVTVIAAKWRRRRRRQQRPRPGDRISGGWSEFVDAALDHGYEPPPSSTRHEVAVAVGSTRAVALAAVADRASFSTQQPSDADADTVWAAVDDLRRSLRTGLTRRERWRAAVSLRSLDRRRR